MLKPYPARSMTTALGVGEAMTLTMRVGGVDLVFGLLSKSPAKSDAGFVDNARIVLTIGALSGQRARVKVQAPDSVKIQKPEKAVV